MLRNLSVDSAGAASPSSPNSPAASDLPATARPLSKAATMAGAPLGATTPAFVGQSASAPSMPGGAPQPPPPPANATPEEFEAYRQQCWKQYFEYTQTWQKYYDRAQKNGGDKGKGRGKAPTISPHQSQQQIARQLGSQQAAALAGAVATMGQGGMPPAAPGRRGGAARPMPQVAVEEDIHSKLLGL
eukprot:TRINITY_DN15982_c0_g1_i3.p1 TRINITY_DN15982_c0_g1~~TRINITY_DN15982_c0_g1_i3.p1  ORF type:complete len:187 (-),score=41.20 TRINITY_DN15982_c0_g1_i3:169-729(-)